MLVHHGQDANVVDGVGLHQGADRALSEKTFAVAFRFRVCLAVVFVFTFAESGDGVVASIALRNHAAIFDVQALGYFVGYASVVSSDAGDFDQSPRIDGFRTDFSGHPLRESLKQALDLGTIFVTSGNIAQLDINYTGQLDVVEVEECIGVRSAIPEQLLDIAGLQDRLQRQLGALRRFSGDCGRRCECSST
jgi:hypothetical protein